MIIETRENSRVAVIDGVDYPLPSLAKGATVNAWYDGNTYQVICYPNDQPEPIPAQVGFEKVFSLPLPYSEAALKLEQAKLAQSEKKAEIEAKALAAFSQPIEVDGIMWRGGQNSAQSIGNAVSMTELLGGTAIELRDAQRKPHTYSIESARSVAAQIGANYLAKWQAEEDALQKLEEVDLSAHDALDQINAITLEVSNV